MDRENNYVALVLRGALAGVLGGLAMQAVRSFVDRRMESTSETLSRRVERAITTQLGRVHPTSVPSEIARAYGGHALMGAVLGAAFGALKYVFGFSTFPFAQIFGTAAWMVAVGRMPPARGAIPLWSKHEHATGLSQLIDRIAFGTVVGIIYDLDKPIIDSLLQHAPSSVAGMHEMTSQEVA